MSKEKYERSMYLSGQLAMLVALIENRIGTDPCPFVFDIRKMIESRCERNADLFAAISVARYEVKAASAWAAQARRG